MRSSISSWSPATAWLLSCALAAACGKHEREQPPAPHAAARDEVPFADTAIKLDGELDEPAWNHRALRGVFAGDDGHDARPYSELRLLRDDTRLLIGLYAADEDIRSTDAFDVTLGAIALHVTAAGVATPVAREVGVDRDGTLDKPDDYDEEWVIETAVPIAELGPPPLVVSATRCDVTKSGERRCGSWHGTVKLATVNP